MATILVLYGTTEGQTRKIASAAADQLESLGHTPVLVDSAAPPEPPGTNRFDAAIVCGSVHQGKHQTSLAHRVREMLDRLERVPNLFLSVSMAAALDGGRNQDEALGYAKSFLEETGWSPDETVCVAGALLYTKYDFFKRLVMKLISRSHGGETDTSRDHEYTDWEDLRETVSRFVERLPAPSSQPVTTGD